jgi:hypothetical protein
MKARTSFLKRVTEGLQKLVSDMIKASKNFNLIFYTKRQIKIVKSIKTHAKVLFYIQDLPKNIHRMTLSL